MPAVRKPASTETAVQSCGRVGVDSVLRADPRALPAHTAVLPSVTGKSSDVIVAADGATSADVLVLIRRAMRRARDELGVTLRTEVQLVGDFGEAEPEEAQAGPTGSGPAASRAGSAAADDPGPDLREGAP